ncbi:putative mucin TcSMUG S, partial [Trypanosoma cruzi]
MMLRPRPLRAFLCPLCACVCARLRRRGSTMLLLLRLGTARIKLQPPPQQQQLRRRRPLPMHPAKNTTTSKARLLATGAASGPFVVRCRCCCLSVPLWRPPVLRA